MSTKIIINVEEGLSRQEMDDLCYLLADAVSEFAVRRTCPKDYVEKRYPDEKDILFVQGMAREGKVKQVQRRVDLATKLHPATLSLNFEHVLPHRPTPIFDYYKTCEEDDLPAMSAALDFLPAAQFGERKGWNVAREGGQLVITGPDDQRAAWWPHLGLWQWDPAHAGAVQ